MKMSYALNFLPRTAAYTNYEYPILMHNLLFNIYKVEYPNINKLLYLQG